MFLEGSKQSPEFEFCVSSNIGHGLLWRHQTLIQKFQVPACTGLFLEKKRKKLAAFVVITFSFLFHFTLLDQGNLLFFVIVTFLFGCLSILFALSSLSCEVLWLLFVICVQYFKAKVYPFLKRVGVYFTLTYIGMLVLSIVCNFR